MQVKQYIVNNATETIEGLERNLCQNNISYVKIENEIHFNNQIIKIIDNKKILLAINNIINKNNHLTKDELNTLLYITHQLNNNITPETIIKESQKNNQPKITLILIKP